MVEYKRWNRISVDDHLNIELFYWTLDFYINNRLEFERAKIGCHSIQNPFKDDKTLFVNCFNSMKPNQFTLSNLTEHLRHQAT